MNKKIKLNLGCGPVYKPGYINIDKFDNTVADKICDVSNLPFKSNTVDLIEAYQLIEHFDYIHCKYILSEWFRILKPEGVLILETPDLEESFKKFISIDLENQKIMLQWFYGIDSLGFQHKTGFTFSLLRNLLEEVGFEKIFREEPKTHRYEPGMRIVCKKPKNFLKKQLFACFRKRLKSKLKTDDSYILIPLESWLKKIFDSYEKLKEDKEACINEIISETAICNPYIPLAFLEECINFGIVKESEAKSKINLLNFLVKTEFHKKVLSLWVKSKKNAGGVEQEFKNFISYLKFSMLDILSTQADYKERFSYIINLEPIDIKIFDFYLVCLEAKKLFNIGIKEFYKKNFSKALSLFLKSSKLNPDNPLIYWNIARLGLILKLEKTKIVENYEKALSLITKKGDRKRIEIELKYTKNSRSDLIQKEPITED
ncbi:MAG: methyltransferase domain-containing protein [Candidatus Aenigmatarchaeota archaeon]